LDSGTTEERQESQKARKPESQNYKNYKNRKNSEKYKEEIQNHVKIARQKGQTKWHTTT
jgi:hypothetical protein